MGIVPDEMVSVREVPWHTVGTIVQDVLTAKDAMVLAGLDWPVTLEPVYLHADHDTRDGGYEIAGFKAVVRGGDDKRVLQIASDQYVPVQNFKAFEFFDTAQPQFSRWSKVLFLPHPAAHTKSKAPMFDRASRLAADCSNQPCG